MTAVTEESTEATVTVKAPPAVHNATGIITRICQGDYGNLSIAESAIDLKKAKDGDIVRLFEIPEGIRIFGLRIYSSASVTSVNAGEHQLCGETDVCNGALEITPWTNTQPDQIITLTLKTVPTSPGRLTCLMEYTAQGSL